VAVVVVVPLRTGVTVFLGGPTLQYLTALVVLVLVAVLPEALLLALSEVMAVEVEETVPQIAEMVVAVAAVAAVRVLLFFDIGSHNGPGADGGSVGCSGSCYCRGSKTFS
jgi:hypothetical protein